MLNKIVYHVKKWSILELFNLNIYLLIENGILREFRSALGFPACVLRSNSS